MLIARNPMDGEILSETPSLNSEQMHERIGDAYRAFDTWQATPISERAEILRAVGTALREDKPRLAELMAKEMGKPVKEGGPEVEKGAWCSEYYAETRPKPTSPGRNSPPMPHSAMCATNHWAPYWASCPGTPRYGWPSAF